MFEADIACMHCLGKGGIGNKLFSSSHQSQHPFSRLYLRQSEKPLRCCAYGVRAFVPLLPLNSCTAHKKKINHARDWKTLHSGKNRDLCSAGRNNTEQPWQALNHSSSRSLSGLSLYSVN